MNDTYIEVTIKPGQPTKVEVFNAHGKECLELTRPLEEGLGITDITAKAEMYEVEVIETVDISVRGQ